VTTLRLVTEPDDDSLERELAVALGHGGWDPAVMTDPIGRPHIEVLLAPARQDGRHDVYVFHSLHTWGGEDQQDLRDIGARVKLMKEFLHVLYARRSDVGDAYIVNFETRPEEEKVDEWGRTAVEQGGAIRPTSVFVVRYEDARKPAWDNLGAVDDEVFDTLYSKRFFDSAPWIVATAQHEN
jgi:hypothetical protein